MQEIVGPDILRAFLLDTNKPISRRRVEQLVADKVLQKNSHGKYPLLENVQAYYRYKNKAPEIVDTDGTVIDFNQERARKTKEEADALARKNKIASGEFVPIAEVQGDISDAVSVCARILGSLKLNIARLAPEVPNRALDLIEKEQAKMLTAIIELDDSYQAREVDDLVVAASD